jgi:hypothetical protein
MKDVIDNMLKKGGHAYILIKLYKNRQLGLSIVAQLIITIIQEGKIWMMVVRGQPRQKVSKTSSEPISWM